MVRKINSVSTLGWVVAVLLLSITFASGVTAQSAPDPEAARAAQIAKARKALAGTTWTVYTALQDAKRPEEGTETFTFTDRRVTTENLAAQGYGVDGSNYSAYIEGDGTIVWETMAKHKDGAGEALLRGDLRGEVMSGVIDIQPEKGARKIYYFTSQKEKPKAAAKKEPTADETASTVSPTVKTTTTTTKTKEPEKKKGGWR